MIKSILLSAQCLGFLIVCYVLYSVADFKLPELKSQWHTIGTGLFAGLTVGAFNIGGPWIAMYGQCRRWRADRFASNLITYQAPTCVLALAVHVFRGSFANKQLWYYAACAIPGLIHASTDVFKSTCPLFCLPVFIGRSICGCADAFPVLSTLAKAVCLPDYQSVFDRCSYHCYPHRPLCYFHPSWCTPLRKAVLNILPARHVYWFAAWGVCQQEDQ